MLDSVLPFSDEEFDVVINAVSIDYDVQSFEIFQEVTRILKPDFLMVVFSKSMFPREAINVRKKLREPERVDFVKRFFPQTESLFLEGTFESTGKPRPKNNEYYAYGIPSDPIYAVWGRKKRSAS